MDLSRSPNNNNIFDLLNHPQEDNNKKSTTTNIAAAVVLVLLERKMISCPTTISNQFDLSRSILKELIMVLVELK
ncbi:hypothetical protein FRX31_023938 [Thalictrum thalictroides]|uniref:Uncharacterized protein n=1 Tax=Thalictrum thalictroides TaxID=46969 RepID=A0A7J6VN06_THATH|nr:hypothetical protein FRX31_023938 [Thalictrum thalictroides]